MTSLGARTTSAGGNFEAESPLAVVRLIPVRICIDH